MPRAVPGAALEPAGGQQTLLLETYINGHSTGRIAEFQEQAGALYVAPADLEELGLRLPPAASARPVAEAPAPADKLIRLDALPGVSWRIHRRSQTLYLDVPVSGLRPTLLGPRRESTQGASAPRSALGAVINYDALLTTQDGSTVTAGFTELRVFSPLGVASHSMLLAGGDTDAPTATRLDTTFTRSDPARLRRYRAGDTISSGLPWSRPVRLAGVQIATDFGLRPDLVTFPVPAFSDQVAVPSSVDVLVNGVRQLSGDVPPGPFELRQLPIVTGAGEVTVVVRDALGRQRSETLPFYASNQLLARELSAFGFEAGLIREQYATTHDHYHSPAGIWTFRHGVRDWLTLESHGEVTRGARMAGAGGSVALGTLGVGTLGLAGSTGQDANGGLYTLALERITQRLSLTASWQAATSRYTDIAAASGDPAPRRITRASAGLALPRAGSLGLAYTQLVPGRGAHSDADSGALRRLSLASLSYSRSVLGGRAFVYATAYQDLSNHASGAQLGLSLPLGARSTLSTGASRAGGQNTYRVQASQSALSVGDVGWQLLEERGVIPRELALGEYRSAHGLVSAGADRTAGATAYRGTLRGTLALAAGDVFATNTIYDSFAVVDTDATPGVQVLQENRPIGRTNDDGRLLVPELRSYDDNRIAIDPRDVPPDADVPSLVQRVRPQDRSGVVLHFPVRASRGALLTLVDAQGAPLPVGSRVRLGVADAWVVVGYDGQAFVRALEPTNTLHALLSDGRTCSVGFAFVPLPGALPQIGPLRCMPEAP